MKISLVIPTKNRLGTLKYCVESCLSSTYQNCEIIVSNNQSEDGTAEYLAGLNDKRLRILTTPEPISMRANFEYALDHTTGDYIFYIGDDDGLPPFGFDALSYFIQNTGADAINWTPLSYVWPNTYSRGALSKLVIRARNFSNDYRVVDHDAVFDRFLDGTINTYMEGAKIYHGCVSRNTINRVRDKADGQYFGAISPDVFVAIANLKFIDKFISTDCSISISGKSANSNGWANIKATGDRKRAELFFKDSETSKVPDPRSIIDLKIRSLRTYELDALMLANENVFGNTYDINFQKWMNLIGNNLNCNSVEEHAENVKKIQKLAIDLTLEAINIPDYTPHKEGTGTSTDILKNRLKNIRCYSRKLATVADAASAVDYNATKIANGNKFTNMINWWKFQYAFTRKILSH